MIKKLLLFFLCLSLFLSISDCKKKLPTTPDIPTKILPTIEYFHATPTSITIDGVSILSWSTKNATNITINQGVGTVSAKDTVEVSPEETTTYTLTATNSAGQKTQSCKVEITSLNLPIIDYFIAAPTPIIAGEYSTLSWSVQSEGLTEALRIEPLGNLTIPWEGSHMVYPTETTTYTLIAVNSDGETTASCSVEVTALNPPVIEFFTATPELIIRGEQSLLSWSVTNADTCVITQNIDSGDLDIDPTGTYSVGPIVPTIFTLTAINDGGETSASCEIHVVPDYEGTWTGFYVVSSCEATGVFDGWCDMFSPGSEYYIYLSMTQVQDQVTAHFTLQNRSASAEGSIAEDGQLLLTGLITEQGDPYTIAVEMQLQSTTSGQITGGLSEYWMYEGLSDYMHLLCNITTLSRW